MSVSYDQASGNRLLSSLAPVDLGDLLEHLQVRRRKMKDVVYDAGGRVRTVEFPISGVISLVTVAGDGSVVEVSTVGNEGMVGLPVLLGSGASGNIRALCQMPGDTLAISARDFATWLNRRERLPGVMGAYVDLQLIEAAQSVACNRLHPVEERSARWLLLNHDRAQADDFPLTHEFMAQMLGVRRASVTLAASVLQRAGLISYRRGRVRIVDRAGLEEAACECYRVVRDAQERLLPSRAIAGDGDRTPSPG